MNPFDFRGPQFLAFYIGLSAAVWIALRLTRLRGEDGDPARIDTSDPYLIASLRGGKNHVLSVVVVSLVDRGLLEARDDSTLAAKTGAAGIVRRPVEVALLRHFASPQPGNSIFTAAGLDPFARGYEDQLRNLDLLASPETRARRRRLFVFGAGLLVFVAVVKLILALQRGHRNVLFLIVLTLVAIVGSWVVTHPRLTSRGKRLLVDLETLFDGVHRRASSIVPGGASTELALLAAVYGLSAVPAAGFPFVKKLFPKASSGDGTTPMGCGSTSSSGCGGGDGGGGGGGGCGGCGS